MKKINIFSAFTIAAISCLFNGCATAPSTRHIPAVTPFDITKYMGKWYEIARLDHHFERGMDNVSAIYSTRPDGRVNVLNSGRRTSDNSIRSISGIARFADSPDRGELEVSFFRPFYGQYRIIILDENYTCAAVCSDTMKYLWILNRSTQPDQKIISRYLEQLRRWNFPVDKLEFIHHEKN